MSNNQETPTPQSKSAEEVYDKWFDYLNSQLGGEGKDTTVPAASAHLALMAMKQAMESYGKQMWDEALDKAAEAMEKRSEKNRRIREGLPDTNAYETNRTIREVAASCYNSAQQSILSLKNQKDGK